VVAGEKLPDKYDRVKLVLVQSAESGGVSVRVESPRAVNKRTIQRWRATDRGRESAREREQLTAHPSPHRGAERRRRRYGAIRRARKPCRAPQRDDRNTKQDCPNNLGMDRIVTESSFHSENLL